MRFFSPARGGGAGGAGRGRKSSPGRYEVESSQTLEAREEAKTR